MKTRSLIIAIIALFFIAPTFGQKLKDKKIQVKYVSLPTEKLPDDYKTYSVNVYGGGIGTAGLNGVSLANSIKMDGFKRIDGVGDNFGHLRVSVYSGYVSTGSAEFKSKTTTKKDKEGNETKTTSYWYEVPFSTTCSFKIVDPEGNVLANYNNPTNNTLSTTSSTSSSSVRKNLSSERNRLRKSFAADATKNIVAAARNTLGKKYDFRHVSDYPQIYIIKKYKSEADFEKSFEKAKELFEKNTAITPAAETKEKMAPYLEIWAKQGSINPKGDKKLKRIYQAANYNLAITYFYLDELDNSKQHAELVIKSEGKDKRSERLLERIEKTKKLMELHGIHTLHYQRDLSDAMAPKQVKAFEEEKEELEADNNSLGGTITMNGEQINGSVLQSKGAEQMFFGEKGNTSFMVEADGKMTEYDLTSNEVSAFSIGERKFIKMNFSPCAKGKEDASMHVLEEIYTSEKINLYQYYPSTGVLGDEKTEFAFQKAGEESPTSLLDTQFLLWNKGIAKYFSSCPDLEGMCAAGDIKMNKDDLLKAGRIYSELCE